MNADELCCSFNGDLGSLVVQVYFPTRYVPDWSRTFDDRLLARVPSLFMFANLYADYTRRTPSLPPFYFQLIVSYALYL